MFDVNGFSCLSVGLAGEHCGMVCVCLQPQRQRRPLEGQLCRQPSFRTGRHGQRWDWEWINVMWIPGFLSRLSSPLGTRVSDPSGHVGGERAPLPPPVALHASQGFADPLAAAACLDSGSGNLSAGYRAPAGSIRGGRYIKAQKFNLLKSMQFDWASVGVFFYLQMWCIWTHVKYLTSDETTENKKSRWTTKFLI